MMYHLFHNSIWKVVRIAKTSDCKISWRVFLQGTVYDKCLASIWQVFGKYLTSIWQEFNNYNKYLFGISSICRVLASV